MRVRRLLSLNCYVIHDFGNVEVDLSVFYRVDWHSR